MTKMTTFHENVTDRPDTSEIDTFSLKITKKCQFSTFPLGLDRGFGHFDQSCPTVVSVVVSLVQK